jgi:hypothetical protein
MEWRKNHRLAGDGYPDLAYLPRTRAGWNATLAALAFGARREAHGPPDLNQWAAMHACPPSARYASLGGEALVLWHGTSAARARKIAEHGLFSKGGLWTTANPFIAHAYTRGRCDRFGAGSGMVVVVLDPGDVAEGAHYRRESEDIYRFHRGLPPDFVEYILYDDRVEFVGSGTARTPRPWRVAHFKKKAGQWIPRSQPPVRFDETREYATRDEWLDLSVLRIFETLELCAPVEVFSLLYATVRPWEALAHDLVFGALERLCDGPFPSHGGRAGVLRLSDAHEHVRETSA